MTMRTYDTFVNDPFTGSQFQVAASVGDSRDPLLSTIAGVLDGAPMLKGKAITTTLIASGMVRDERAFAELYRTHGDVIDAYLAEIELRRLVEQTGVRTPDAVKWGMWGFAGGVGLAILLGYLIKIGRS